MVAFHQTALPPKPILLKIVVVFRVSFLQELECLYMDAVEQTEFIDSFEY